MCIRDSTKTECAEKLEKLKEEYRPPSTRCKPDMLFGDWMEFWYENYSKPAIRPLTQENYENRIYDHIIPEIGQVIEMSEDFLDITGTVPTGGVLVDGLGIGDVGNVVLRDRKHLAQDGMIVVCVNLSAQNGEIVTGPDIITRGFIYVKESEELMDSLREVAEEAIDRCRRKRIRDWSAIKTAIKNDLSGYLYKTTKRNPMILPVIMEV